MRDSINANPVAPERRAAALAGRSSQIARVRRLVAATYGPAIGTVKEKAWLRRAITFQGGQRLTATQVSRLKLADPGSAPPRWKPASSLPGSPSEATRDAVLGGLCSEAEVAAPGYAGISSGTLPSEFPPQGERDQLTYAMDWVTRR